MLRNSVGKGKSCGGVWWKKDQVMSRKSGGRRGQVVWKKDEVT